MDGQPQDFSKDRPYEKFDISKFVAAILASAVMLLILPIGFIFHFEVILYAALLATALQFVAIWKMTAARLFG